METQKPFHLRMAHFPTLKILVYRTLQNAIQPPSAGKKSLPHVWDCPLQSHSAVETKCPARRNKSQVSAKVMMHSQPWTAASLRTKLMSCTQETAFIPIKTGKDIPQMTPLWLLLSVAHLSTLA